MGVTTAQLVRLRLWGACSQCSRDVRLEFADFQDLLRQAEAMSQLRCDRCSKARR